MKYVLTGMCALEIIDGGLTWWAVNAGVVREGNVLVATWAGDWIFVVLKVLGSLICALALWMLHKHFPKTAMLSANSVIAMYIAILAWNLHILI